MTRPRRSKPRTRPTRPIHRGHLCGGFHVYRRSSLRVSAGNAGLKQMPVRPLLPSNLIYDIGYAPFRKGPLNCFPKCSARRVLTPVYLAPSATKFYSPFIVWGDAAEFVTTHGSNSEFSMDLQLFAMIQPVVLSSWCQAADRQEYTSMGQTNIKTHVLI